MAVHTCGGEGHEPCSGQAAEPVLIAARMIHHDSPGPGLLYITGNSTPVFAILTTELPTKLPRAITHECSQSPTINTVSAMAPLVVTSMLQISKAQGNIAGTSVPSLHTKVHC